MNNSLDVLSESLDRKIAVLHEIEEYNEQQRQTFESDNPDMALFDRAIEKKEELISRLEKLDEGFEILYKNLSEELKANRDKYADKIRELQQKITVITELSVSIQATEARNKKLIERYFSKERESIRSGRVGSRAAYDYYKSMTGAGLGGSHFMDSKN